MPYSNLKRLKDGFYLKKYALYFINLYFARRAVKRGNSRFIVSLFEAGGTGGAGGAIVPPIFLKIDKI